MGLNQGWTYREQVSSSAVGQSVLQYYTTNYRHSNEQEWRERIASGQILVNGQQVAPEAKLQPGQKLTYNRPPWLEPFVPLSFEVIYEDHDLLAIAKPSGLPVLPGGGFLENTVLWQVKKLYPDNPPVPVHRLGRGTSGLLLLAKSAIAKSCLSRQMRANTTEQRNNERIEKIYLAKVATVSSAIETTESPTNHQTLPDRFTITQSIGKISHPYLGYVYGAKTPGKFAHSECQVIKRNSDSTIIQVTILTGRPHQIRIHLASIGYPLIGDPLYTIGGIPKVDPDNIVVPGDCGYHLHAYRLGFTHPRDYERINLVCNPPSSLT